MKKSDVYLKLDTAHALYRIFKPHCVFETTQNEIIDPKVQKIQSAL